MFSIKCFREMLLWNGFTSYLLRIPSTIYFYKMIKQMFLQNVWTKCLCKMLIHHVPSKCPYSTFLCNLPTQRFHEMFTINASTTCFYEMFLPNVFINHFHFLHGLSCDRITDFWAVKYSLKNASIAFSVVFRTLCLSHKLFCLYSLSAVSSSSGKSGLYPRHRS